MEKMTGEPMKGLNT